MMIYGVVTILLLHKAMVLLLWVAWLARHIVGMDVALLSAQKVKVKKENLKTR